MLGHLGETWVITRANNRSAIEQELETTGPLVNVHFVYVDLPPNLRRWKQGQRGIRLYYLLWQGAALGKRADSRATSRSTLPGTSLLRTGGLDRLRACLACRSCTDRSAAGLGRRGDSPALSVRRESSTSCFALRRACPGVTSIPLRGHLATSIVDSRSERGDSRWLPRRHRVKAHVFPNVVLEGLPVEPPPRGVAGDSFAGRLLPWKGVSLAIAALDELPGWRLIVCGDGPDSARLRRQAASCGRRDRVDFRGWVDHGEVLRAMREDASVFVFPSLHDDAGFVVVEAMASGLPVVSLLVGGPATLADHTFGVMPAGRRLTTERIAQRVLETKDADSESVCERAREFLIPTDWPALTSSFRSHSCLRAKTRRM